VAGSQGTLALVTEAELDTSLLPEHVGVALMVFDRLESAVRAALEVLAVGVTACDLIDRRHLGLARDSDVRYDLLIPEIAEAVLVVECESPSVAGLRDRLAAVSSRVRDRRLAIDARPTLEPEEMELYWRLATRVVPRLYRLKGSARPLPFVEDVVVPPPALPEFLVKLQNVLKEQEVTASLFGHAGHGRMHVRPFLDLSRPDDVAKLLPLAEGIYGVVLAAGGFIGGEVGDGLSRTPFLPRQYGALYDAFRHVKAIFDPQGILNPGKVVADEPMPLSAHLRGWRRPAGGAGLASATVPLRLNWTSEEMLHVAESCNGCAACRTQSPQERMCPIFRFLPREEASPRAKANLMRGILQGALDPHLLPRDEFKEIADLCVNCQQCRRECPAGVDIPKLMIEAKAAHVAHNGLSPTDWLITRLDLAAALASLVSPLVNWALGSRQARWMLEKLLGVARGRKLPRVARRSFLRRAQRRRLGRPSRQGGPKVLYFVDTFANYFDPQLADAFVAVLEHNGVSVYVPGGQVQSGMALVSLGAVDAARKLAARNVSLLAEAARHGYHVVATEPAAALCLSREYPQLLDDDEAHFVAAHTSDACAYLWQLHRQGRLQLDFRPLPLTLGYHLPCMTKAQEIGAPGENLLRLIPGLVVSSREVGCSGMAGTFGLKRENYRSSLRAGWGLVSRMREPGLSAGATECSACRIQMEQGTTKPTIHPIKLLAHAYGLMPDVGRLLSARGHDLLLTC
jgi:Fe-S oxidoreductase